MRVAWCQGVVGRPDGAVRSTAQRARRPPRRGASRDLVAERARHGRSRDRRTRCRACAPTDRKTRAARPRTPSPPRRRRPGLEEGPFERREVEMPVLRRGNGRPRRSTRRGTPLRRPRARTSRAVGLGVQRDQPERLRRATVVELADRVNEPHGALTAVDDREALRTRMSIAASLYFVAATATCIGGECLGLDAHPEATIGPVALRASTRTRSDLVDEPRRRRHPSRRANHHRPQPARRLLAGLRSALTRSTCRSAGPSGPVVTRAPTRRRSGSRARSGAARSRSAGLGGSWFAGQLHPPSVRSTSPFAAPRLFEHLVGGAMEVHAVDGIVVDSGAVLALRPRTLACWRCGRLPREPDAAGEMRASPARPGRGKLATCRSARQSASSVPSPAVQSETRGAITDARLVAVELERGEQIRRPSARRHVKPGRQERRCQSRRSPPFPSRPGSTGRAVDPVVDAGTRLADRVKLGHDGDAGRRSRASSRSVPIIGPASSARCHAVTRSASSPPVG